MRLIAEFDEGEQSIGTPSEQGEENEPEPGERRLKRRITIKQNPFYDVSNNVSDDEKDLFVEPASTTPKDVRSVNVFFSFLECDLSL